MARKKKHPEHVNHERWLISYADFITLLFAFFVVMFASSQVDSKKVGRFSESFSKAVGIEVFPQSGTSLLPGAPQPPPDGDRTGPSSSALPPELEGLRNELSQRKEEKNAELGSLQLVSRRNELVLRMSDTVLFDSGDDRVKPRARDVLVALSAELKKRRVNVRVEGHTDDKPIRTSRFRSNWDLSTARATAVVVELAAQQIPPERLSAAGYAEFHPIAPNTTPAERATNRRVDLVVSVPPRIEPRDEEKVEKNDKSEKVEKTEPREKVEPAPKAEPAAHQEQEHEHK